jgi:hypothetical protein
MDWLRRLLAKWRTHGPVGVRRIIVLEIVGLEPALVDDYLEQGLLHHLALLCDIGGRALFSNSALSAADGSLCNAIGELGIRSIVLRPAAPRQPVDLAAICAADRAQQERLFAALARSRPAVVVGVFDMPARTERLFGPRPDENQRLVLRDVYARMDEVVGKAFSFVDTRTALLAVIRGQACGEPAPSSTRTGLLFSSRKLSRLGADRSDLATSISDILCSSPRDS